MIFLGNFLFVTNQKAANIAERRHGEFNLIVEAQEEAIAIEKFRDRILKFKKESSFFEGACDIFFSRLLRFDDFPSDAAVMVDYKSFAGDPAMPYIQCSLPSAERNACIIHQWQENHPKSDGEENQLFLSFTDDENSN